MEGRRRPRQEDSMKRDLVEGEWRMRAKDRWEWRFVETVVKRD